MPAFFAARPLLLAPMAGVNDPAFRLICKRMGAALTFSEMISAAGMRHKNPKTEELLLHLDGEAPFAVQLFGSDPCLLAEQAARLEDRLGDALALIDINMACPVRKVAGKGEGAALMRDPARAARILGAVVTATARPVTVKIRRGFYCGEETCVEFARMAEAQGAAAVTVHGRFAQQLYQGHSERAAVGRVAAAVSVPVIASGDVHSVADVADYFENQGAAAVMAARGAQGNPWLFSHWAGGASAGQPTHAERTAVAWEHARLLAQADPHRLVGLRRHVAWYFRGMPHAAALRRRVQECVSIDDYRDLMDAVASWN